MQYAYIAHDFVYTNQVQCMKTIQNAFISTVVNASIYFWQAQEQFGRKNSASHSKIQWQIDDGKNDSFCNTISGNAAIRKLKTSLVTSISFIYETKNMHQFFATKALLADYSTQKQSPHSIFVWPEIFQFTFYIGSFWESFKSNHTFFLQLSSIFLMLRCKIAF